MDLGLNLSPSKYFSPQISSNRHLNYNTRQYCYPLNGPFKERTVSLKTSCPEKSDMHIDSSEMYSIDCHAQMPSSVSEKKSASQTSKSIWGFGFGPIFSRTVRLALPRADSAGKMAYVVGGFVGSKSQRNDIKRDPYTIGHFMSYLLEQNKGKTSPPDKRLAGTVFNNLLPSPRSSETDITVQFKKAHVSDSVGVKEIDLMQPKALINNSFLLGDEVSSDFVSLTTNDRLSNVAQQCCRANQASKDPSIKCKGNCLDVRYADFNDFNYSLSNNTSDTIKNDKEGADSLNNAYVSHTCERAIVNTFYSQSPPCSYGNINSDLNYPSDACSDFKLKGTSSDPHNGQISGCSSNDFKKLGSLCGCRENEILKNEEQEKIRNIESNSSQTEDVIANCLKIRAATEETQTEKPAHEVIPEVTDSCLNMIYSNDNDSFKASSQNKKTPEHINDSGLSMIFPEDGQEPFRYCENLDKFNYQIPSGAITAAMNAISTSPLNFLPCDSKRQKTDSFCSEEDSSRKSNSRKTECDAINAAMKIFSGSLERISSVFEGSQKHEMQFCVRLLSECSVASTDSDSVVFEGCYDDFEDDYDEYSESQEDDDADEVEQNSCRPITPDSLECNKKVRFTEKPEVRVMCVWDYASRAARVGPWEQAARDRARFTQRIKRTAEILNPVLEHTHREKVWGLLKQQ